MVDRAAEVIHLVATLKAKPGQRSALVDALEAIVPDVRQEDGCLRYDLSVDRDHPDLAVMLESWRDGAALDAHARAAPFRSLASRLDAFLAEPLHLQRLQQIL